MSPPSIILNQNNEYILQMARNTAVGEYFWNYRFLPDFTPTEQWGFVCRAAARAGCALAAGFPWKKSWVVWTPDLCAVSEALTVAV